MLKPDSDECVLVFHIDCDAFRQSFALVGQKVCDILIFVKRKNSLPKLVFIELKSSDYKTAVNQIKSVIPKIKDKIEGKRLEATYHVVVLLSDPVPGGSEKTLVKELHKMGVILKFKGGVRKGHAPVDLRPLIA